MRCSALFKFPDIPIRIRRPNSILKRVQCWLRYNDPNYALFSLPMSLFPGFDSNSQLTFRIPPNMWHLFRANVYIVSIPLQSMVSANNESAKSYVNCSSQPISSKPKIYHKTQRKAMTKQGNLLCFLPLPADFDAQFFCNVGQVV